MTDEKDRRHGATYHNEAYDVYWKVFRRVAPKIKKLHRIKTINGYNLPYAGAGGVIICAVHNGAIDAAMISIAAADRMRAVRWVADEGICNTPVIGEIIRDAGCIPIASHKGKSTDPGQVRQAMSAATELIREGGTLGIFPEGAIHPFYRNRRTLPFKTGIIRIAIETGAPIVPAWARGAGAIFPWLSPMSVKNFSMYLALPLWTPVRVRVHFGEPFSVREGLSIESPYEEIKQECARLQDSVDNLIKESRAPRADHDDSLDYF